MTLQVGFKYGIVLQSDGSQQSEDYVLIPPESSFWNLPTEEKIEILNEARASIKWVNAVCLIDGIFYPSESAFVCMLDNDEKTRAALFSFPDNPFLDEQAKQRCSQLIQIYQDYKQNQAQKEAQKRRAHGTLRDRIIERDKSTCRYCSTKIENRSQIHIDHVIPYSLGGLTELDNLVVACVICNSKKSGKTLEEAGMTLLPIPDES